MMHHTKWHWACCWKMVLWGLSALALVLAWVSVYMKGLVLGLEPLAWYWNALVLGVLANGCKAGCGSCGTCDSEEKGGM